MLKAIGEFTFIRILSATITAVVFAISCNGILFPLPPAVDSEVKSESDSSTVSSDTDVDSDTDTDADTDADSDTDGDMDADTDTDGDADSESPDQRPFCMEPPNMCLPPQDCNFTSGNPMDDYFRCEDREQVCCATFDPCGTNRYPPSLSETDRCVSFGSRDCYDSGLIVSQKRCNDTATLCCSDPMEYLGYVPSCDEGGLFGRCTKMDECLGSGGTAHAANCSPSGNQPLVCCFQLQKPPDSDKQ